MFMAKIAHRIFLVGILLCAAAGSASVSLRAAVSYPVGTNPRTVAVGDFNGDSKPDLAVIDVGDSTKNDPGGVSILLGNGDGTFKPAINFAVGNNPSLVAVGDFDNDGKDDLAILRPGVVGGSDKGDVTIFLSNGDGTFQKGQQISTFNNPTAVITADFNSDGAVDLAVSDASSITIMLGNSDGTFQSVANYSNSARLLFVLDFNRDGKKDLGITFERNTFAPHAIGILLGNGDGTFQSLSPLNGYLLSPSFSADFNHDGNVDVILNGCNPFTGVCGAYLLLSNGDGTFSDPPGTNVLTNGVATVGDFDGDGNPDLAGPANNGQSALVIFAGNGDGSFQQPATFPVNSNSSIEVALAADLNNDKAPDLVFIGLRSNADTNAMSVMLNSGTDFTLSAGPLTPGSIAAGQSANSALGLQLLNSFNNPVTLSCSVQPAQAGAPTCSFNTDSVVFDSSGKASATLTISAGSLAQLNTGRLFSLGTLLWSPLVGAAILGTGLSSRSRSKHMLLGIVLLAVLPGLISLQACGGGGSGGPNSTNYAITVTGTAGQATHSTTVNVTVQ
jgi:FG-GAP-like repeat